MGRKKLEDLAEFHGWLRTHRLLTANSASTYTSRVRAVLNSVAPLTAEGIRQFATSENEVKSANVTLTAWGHFVQFGALKGVPVPAAGGPAASGPHPIAQALYGICAGDEDRPNLTPMPTEVMVRLRQSDVQQRLAATRSFLVKVDGGNYQIDVDHVATIRAWSNPTCADDPFLPSEPSSDEPMTVATANRIMRGRDRA